jgi:protein-disulfide isomerase
MKTLYSSSFLSLIIAFFMFLGINGDSIVIQKDQLHPLFSTILRPLPNPPGTPVELPTVVDVYYTFGCPGCASFGAYTIPALQEKYLESDNVELRFNVIPNTEDEGQYYAAVGVKCAAEQGKYWEMHRELNLTTEPLSFREVDLIGQELEFPIMEFRSCLKSGKYDEEIGAEIQKATDKGVSTLPVIFIEGYKLIGNQPVENIIKIISEIQNPKL